MDIKGAKGARLAAEAAIEGRTEERKAATADREAVENIFTVCVFVYCVGRESDQSGYETF